MSEKQIIVASLNRHKIQEIKGILGPSWQVLGAGDLSFHVDWNETGSTFLENARLKVAALRRKVGGLGVLADDSGLCVDALGGAPGVYSSSYGGIEGDHARNLTRLMEELKDVPDSRRQAHFYCLILYVDVNGSEFIFEGVCPGRISLTEAGRGGFGYDPVFIPNGYSVTMAEMSEVEKNLVSHRGMAMRAFAEKMRDDRR